MLIIRTLKNSSSNLWLIPLILGVNAFPNQTISIPVPFEKESPPRHANQRFAFRWHSACGALNSDKWTSTIRQPKASLCWSDSPNSGRCWGRYNSLQWLQTDSFEPRPRPGPGRRTDAYVQCIHHQRHSFGVALQVAWLLHPALPRTRKQNQI